MCSHTTIYAGERRGESVLVYTCPRTAICVLILLILLYMCSHANFYAGERRGESMILYICRRPAIYVS